LTLINSRAIYLVFQQPARTLSTSRTE